MRDVARRKECGAQRYVRRPTREIDALTAGHVRQSAPLREALLRSDVTGAVCPDSVYAEGAVIGAEETAMRSAILGLTIVMLACGAGGKPAEAPPPPLSDAPAPAPPAATNAQKAKGIKAIEGGDAQAAKTALEAAIKADPRDAEAPYYLGVALERLGDKAGAETAYRAALKLRPDFAEAAGNLGAFYIDAARFDEAVVVLKPASQKQPDRAELHTNLALALAGKGDQAAATSEFDAAVKLSPRDATLLFTYGHQLGAWGQSEAALAKLRAARAAAGDSVDLGAAIGHEFLLLRAPTDCVAAFDAVIARKDAAALRTERGLCKLASKDAAGAQIDFEQAVAKEPGYALAHYWLGLSLLNAKKSGDGVKSLEVYLKLDPKGAKAKAAEDAIARATQKK